MHAALLKKLCIVEQGGQKNQSDPSDAVEPSVSCVLGVVAFQDICARCPNSPLFPAPWPFEYSASLAPAVMQHPYGPLLPCSEGDEGRLQGKRS